MLNAALARVDALEQELATTKKALEEAVVREAELIAYFDKKKKKKSALVHHNSQETQYLFFLHVMYPYFYRSI
ncbi:hypothetical protein QQ045_027139 [Rhodiola kirilowii]